MRWVYILQCEDSYFYVGETSRLYREKNKTRKIKKLYK